MFQIDFKSRKSIYEQVVDNFKELILSGVIGPNEKMPSLRDLSKQITVNPNTVQKAYRELERQGYIYSVSGVGTFATPLEDIMPDEKMLADIREQLNECLKELVYLGMNEGEIKKTVEDMLKIIVKKMANNKRQEEKDD